MVMRRDILIPIFQSVAFKNTWKEADLMSVRYLPANHAAVKFMQADQTIGAGIMKALNREGRQNRGIVEAAICSHASILVSM